MRKIEIYQIMSEQEICSYSKLVKHRQSRTKIATVEDQRLIDTWSYSCKCTNTAVLLVYFEVKRETARE